MLRPSGLSTLVPNKEKNNKYTTTDILKTTGFTTATGSSDV